MARRIATMSDSSRRRCASVVAIVYSRWPMTVSPASVRPPTIASSDITVTYWPTATGPRYRRSTIEAAVAAMVPTAQPPADDLAACAPGAEDRLGLLDDQGRGLALVHDQWRRRWLIAANDPSAR